MKTKKENSKMKNKKVETHALNIVNNGWDFTDSGYKKFRKSIVKLNGKNYWKKVLRMAIKIENCDYSNTLAVNVS